MLLSAFTSMAPPGSAASTLSSPASLCTEATYFVDNPQQPLVLKKPGNLASQWWRTPPSSSPWQENNIGHCQLRAISSHARRTSPCFSSPGLTSLLQSRGCLCRQTPLYSSRSPSLQLCRPGSATSPHVTYLSSALGASTQSCRHAKLHRRREFSRAAGDGNVGEDIEQRDSSSSNSLEVVRIEDGSEREGEGDVFFPRWDVPWGWETTTLTLLAWIGTFLFTGVVTSVGLAKLSFARGDLSEQDFKALVLLIHQLAQTSLGLLLINFVSRKHAPLPPDFFRIDPGRRPFAWRDGWLLWGVLGIPLAVAAVQAAATLVLLASGESSPSPREDADALVQVLPIIAASPFSTISLIIVTGVCAPILEETIFRGFLMTSLTKYIPTPAAAAVSAVVFAGAHLTPGEFVQLSALGFVLGLSYGRTRNLLTPMLIHSFWNSGIIIVLTLLRLEGYDIQELL